MGDKVIIKSDYYYTGGVDQTMLPPTTLGDNEVVWGNITHPFFREKTKVFLGINQYLLKGEVFSLRGRDILYRINSNGKFSSDKKGYLYEIKRLDGNSISGPDFSFSKVGIRVIFENRREYKQKLNYGLLDREKQQGENCKCKDS